jgi:hypothetical protein
MAHRKVKILQIILTIEVTTHASVNLRLAFFPPYHGYLMSTCAEHAAVERHMARNVTLVLLC